VPKYIIQHICSKKLVNIYPITPCHILAGNVQPHKYERPLFTLISRYITVIHYI